MRPRIPPWLVLASVAVAIASPLAGAPSERAARLPGLRAPVEVLTDRWGIPHVRAANLEDLYLAWGWVHARDRLWQMVYARAAGDGLTHRWLGNRALQADGGAQLFRLRERAHAIWQRERRDDGVRMALERYAQGVNALLAECRRGERPWPAELRRLGERPADWQPEDCVLVLLGFGITLDLDLPELAEARTVAEHGATWWTERRRYEDRWMYDSVPDSAALRLWRPSSRARGAANVAPAEPMDAALGAERTLATGDGPTPGAVGPSTGPALPSTLVAAGGVAARAIDGWLDAFPPRDADGADRASNAFVVGAARSASGRPLLANDPHLGLTTPGPIHVVHVQVPGLVDAVGGGTPGLPIIVLGRNARAAWGVTALSADVADVYADSLSADGRRVRTVDARGRESWAPVESRPYRMGYRVLGLTLPIPPFVQERRYTPHGPVLAWEPKRRRALSLRWAAFEDERIHLDSLVGLERATRARELTERFSTLVTPCLNVVAADVDGDVRYRAVGLLPARASDPGPGLIPADGRHEWTGFIPADSMPQWRAPADGFAVNANNRPAGALYPWALPRYDWPHDRARRIAQRLAGDRSITVADAMSVQNDVVSLAAERNLRHLIGHADSLWGILPPRAQAALDTLRAWDHAARRSKVAPTLYRAWFGAWQRRLGLEGLPGLALATAMGRAPEVLARSGRDGAAETPAEAACAALVMALDTLEVRLGPDLARWTYRRAHVARFRHPLSVLDGRARWEAPATPEDGDNASPSVGPSRLPWNIEVVHGPVFRHVVDLSRPDVSYAVVPPWNSAAFGAEGDRDLRRRWADHAYVPLFLDWERATSAALERVRLAP